jgi:hypothetical protein
MRGLGREARTVTVRALAVALLAFALLGVAACAPPPPAISKAELDSNKLPKKHPVLADEQVKAGCRSCHREQPPVKQP